MTEILTNIEGNRLGLDKDDNLLVKGTKIITNHLGTERSIEPQADGSLKVNGANFGAGPVQCEFELSVSGHGDWRSAVSALCRASAFVDGCPVSALI
mgnify:CR=1 FL=1